MAGGGARNGQAEVSRKHALLRARSRVSHGHVRCRRLNPELCKSLQGGWPPNTVGSGTIDGRFDTASCGEAAPPLLNLARRKWRHAVRCFGMIHHGGVPSKVFARVDSFYRRFNHLQANPIMTGTPPAGVSHQHTAGASHELSGSRHNPSQAEKNKSPTDERQEKGHTTIVRPCRHNSTLFRRPAQRQMSPQNVKIDPFDTCASN